MKQNPKYSDHQETLIALVTHLAMTDWSARTPTNLSKALSIEKDEIVLVLESFKGLFRKANKTSKKRGENFYTLQIRHARQWLNEAEEEDEDTKKPPLETEYLTKLLDFVISRSSEERQNRINSIGLWVTTIASLIVAALAIVFKSG